MKYYKIIVRRAHVGTGNQQYITFYTAADNMIAALDIIQKKRGIHRNKLPLSCIEVSKNEFYLQLQNQYNAYAECGAK